MNLPSAPGSALTWRETIQAQIDSGFEREEALDGPELDDELAVVMRMFNELQTKRGTNGMGGGLALAWTEMLAYATLHRMEWTATELHLIGALDVAYLVFQSKQQQEKALEGASVG